MKMLKEGLKKVKAEIKSTGKMLKLSKAHYFFDRDYYEGQINIEFENVEKALDHYMKLGFKECVAPSNIFDLDYYFKQFPELRNGTTNPVSHYLQNGSTDLSSPHPIFDARYYLTTNNISTTENPFIHFLSNGNDLGYSPHPLFDIEYYLNIYPDVREAGLNGLVHYTKFGGLEGRNPHPFFNSEFYIDKLRNQKIDNVEPLNHFLTSNDDIIINPNNLFDVKAYFNANPDVKAANVNSLVHYITQGIKEGRLLGDKVEKRIKSSIHFNSIGLNRGNWVDNKIVITSHDASRTGAPLIILKITEILTKKYNYDCTVVLLDDGPLLEDFKNVATVINVKDIFPEGMMHQNAAVNFLLFNTLKDTPQFGICNSAQSHTIMDMLNYLNIPFISLIHEFAEPYTQSVVEKIVRISKDVIYPAQIVKDSAVKKISSEPPNLQILPQGLFDSEFPKGDRNLSRKMVRKELGLGPNTQIYLGCGYVDLRKGCDLFVQASKLFFENNPDADVVFVWLGEYGKSLSNENYEHWLFQDIESAGLKDKVRFIGSRENVEKYFLASDAFLMLSRQDPFPCVVLEAMACKMPIILFKNATGSIDAIGEQGGYRIPYLNISETVKALSELYIDPKVGQNMGIHNESVVREKYNYEKYVEDILNIIQNRLAFDLNSNRVDSNQKVKKIIIPCSDWWISGVNNLVESIGGELIKMGWEFEIVFTRSKQAVLDTATRNTKQGAKVILPTVPYKFLSPDSNLDTFTLWKDLISYIESQGPCIMLTGYDYLANAISPALSDNIGIVGWNHADDMEYYEQAYRLGRYWNAQVCVSEQIKNEILKTNPAYQGRVHFITNSTIDNSEILDKKSIPGKKIKLIYTGRIVQYQKRILDFIRLSDALEAAGINYQLTIVGGDQDGSEEQLRASLQDRIDKKKVIIPGMLGKQEVFDLLKENHYFVLLSDFEGMPISLIEAMSQGCIPIVPMMKSGIPEIVENGENGFIMESRNYVDWANLIKEVGCDSDRFASISNNVLETISSRYTVDKIATQFQEIFRQVANEIEDKTYQRPETLKWNSKTGDILPPQNLMC